MYEIAIWKSQVLIVRDFRQGKVCVNRFLLSIIHFSLLNRIPVPFKYSPIRNYKYTACEPAS